MTTYKIVRKYQSEGEADVEVETGLTLLEAQTYCINPETSSRTCSSEEAQQHTQAYGPWFDAYYEE
jgi:hypothetical protein